MSYELEKIRTLSQGNGSYKTELYPKTLIDAVYSVNGEKLEDLMYQTIADEISKFATGDLSSSYALKKDVYNKTEIDTKLEPLATHSEVNNKADKNHNHDEKYSSLYHEHDQYALRSAVETSLFELERDLKGGAPEELNTLGKLAMAIDNDDQFFNTVSLEISKKLNKSDFEGALDNCAPLEHNHDERYYKRALTYNKEEVDALILGQSTDIVNRFALKSELNSAVDAINNNLTNNYLKATQIESKLFEKVDKVDGKGLSTNDFTMELLAKLNGIEDSANNYIHPETHPATMITGLHNVATSGDYRQLNNTPTNLSDFTNDCDFTTNAKLNEVNTRITNLIGGDLPSGLQTIRQICLSINDDPAFAQTVATNLQNKANELTKDYETKISNLETTLNTTIQNEVNTLNSKIIAIYGTESDKTDLKNLKLDTLRAIVTSIGEKTDLIGYIDSQDADLQKQITEINTGFIDRINAIYGGEGAKTVLEGYGLESLLNIAAAIDNDRNFGENIKTSISDLTTKHNNEIKSLYGYTNDISELRDLNNLLAIATSLNFDTNIYNTITTADTELQNNIKALTNKHNDEIKELYGYTNDKSELKGLDTLLKISNSLDNDLNFGDTVKDLIDALDTKHDTEVAAIYGTDYEHRGFTYNSLKLLNDTLSDGGTFYTMVTTGDKDTLDSAKSHTNTEISNIKGGELTTNYSTLKNIETTVEGYNTTLTEKLTDLSGKHNREILDIYGQENKNFTYNSLKLINDTLLENGTFYTFVLNKDTETLNSANTYTNTTKTNIYGVPEGKTINDDFSTIYNIQEHVTSSFNSMSETATNNLAAAKSYTDTKVSDLINGAPGALDTLKELADALGEDPNFATTVTNNISNINTRITRLISGASEDKQIENASNLYNIEKIVTSLGDKSNVITYIGEQDDLVKSDIKGGELTKPTNYSTLKNIETTVEGYKTTLTNSINTLTSDNTTAHNEIISSINTLKGGDLPSDLPNVLAIATTLSKGGTFRNYVDEADRTLQSNIDTLSNKVTTNEGTMNAVSSKLNDYVTSNNEEITNLKAADANMLSYIKGIVGDGLTAISAQKLTTINKIVKALDDDENFHTTVSDNLNTAITTLTTDKITPLKNTVDAHLKDFTDYKTSIEEAYKQADTTLHTTITNETTAVVNKAVTDLKGTVTTNNDTLGKLETNIKSVSDTVSANKTALEEKINTTKKEILGDVTDVNNNLGKLEATINKTKSDILGNVSEDNNTLEKLEDYVESTKEDILGGVSTSNNTLKKLEDTISTSKRELVDAINTAKSSVIGTATENYNTLGKIQAILMNTMTTDDVNNLLTNVLSYTPSASV